MAAAIGLLGVWLLALASALFSPQLGAGEATGRPALDAYGKLPLSFVPNAGQVDRSVRYHARGPGFEFYFMPDKVILSLARKKQAVALHLTPLGTNKGARLEARRRGEGRINHLIGRERHVNLPTYREVAYRSLWPGVDLVFRGLPGALKYELHVRPGADPRKIRLAYGGADRLSVGSRGDLLIHTSLGALRDSRPRSHQLIGGKRVPVSSRYALDSGRAAYGFELGASYDPDHPLVIDPGIAYSTYLGGASDDRGVGIAVDSERSAYVTGETGSSTFPTTPGAFDRNYSGGDTFVTKLTASGALSYSTFLGGSFVEVAGGIDVDGEGSAYLTGYTASRDFPTTPGAYDTTFNGDAETYVTKLNASGSGLVYSTYLGGGSADLGEDIAVDESGAAYVTGDTRSDDFPTTVSAFDRTPNGLPAFHVDGFVTKLDTTGSNLVYSTYLGGESVQDALRGITVDGAGSAYVTGDTASTDFPTTPGAYDPTYNGGGDAVVTKLNASGSGLAYSTFLGGSTDVFGTTDDFAYDVVVDSGANAYVVGLTASSDFPTTPGAYDRHLDGISDSYVSKLNATGSGLGYSTFLGEGVIGRAIAVDPAGDAFVAGGVGPPDGEDVAVIELNATGSAITFSTSFGGSSSELAAAIARDPLGNVYVTGETTSTDFPTTPNANDTTANGGSDAFVAKIEIASPPATLTLDPQAATNPVGSSHCVTATVKDRFGTPTAGVTVRFSVTGAHQLRRSATTDRNGKARICYTGSAPGTDTIRAFADTDRDGIRDQGEPQGQATKTWTPRPALDHYVYYPTEDGTPAFVPRTVTIRDQFRTSQARVVEPLRLLNPASKDGGTISRPDAHLKCYRIEESRFAGRTVSVRNQLGAHTFQVGQPTRLCNPASKKVPPGTPPPIPSGIDHFRCYGVEGSPLNRAVNLRDQFGRQAVVVQEPEYLCNPASKNGSGIQRPPAHLVCYELGWVDPFTSRRASLRDQFGVQTFTVTEPTKLCVPSRKQT